MLLRAQSVSLQIAEGVNDFFYVWGCDWFRGAELDVFLNIYLYWDPQGYLMALRGGVYCSPPSGGRRHVWRAQVMTSRYFMMKP